MECHGYGHLHRFQSTLPNGSDGIFHAPFSPALIFQSTLPNGSDGKHAQYRIQKSCKVSNNYLYILHITPFICISKHQSRIFSYHLSVRISLTFHVHLPFAPYITTAPTIFQLKWHITLFCNCIKLEF